MSEPIFWSDVSIDVQTVLGDAITLTAITKTSPAVATYSGTVNPADGDVIVLAVQGMKQVDATPVRVANVNTSGKTFELEGVDATDYSTFSSGSFRIATLGASMTTAQTVSVSGGEPEFADLTTIHASSRRRAPTLTSPMQLTMDNIFLIDDPALLELNRATKSKTTRVVQLGFSNGMKMLIAGYASAPLVPTGEAQSVVQTRVTIEAQNLPTIYAS